MSDLEIAFTQSLTSSHWARYFETQGSKTRWRGVLITITHRYTHHGWGICSHNVLSGNTSSIDVWGEVDGIAPVLLLEVIEVPDAYRHDHRIGPHAKQVLRHLMDNFGRHVTNDELIHVLYGHDDEGGPLTAENIIRLHVTHLRKRLRPGWSIENVRHKCYQLVYREPRELRKAA